MHLPCQVKVIRGTTNGRNMQAILHVGLYKDCPEPVLLVVTSAKSNERMYKLKRNIKRFHTKFVPNGLATIQFVNPHDIVHIFDANPVRLKKFIERIRIVSVLNEDFQERIDIGKIKTNKNTTNLKVSTSIDFNNIISFEELSEVSLADSELKDLPRVLGTLNLKVLRICGNKLCNSEFRFFEEKNIQRSLQILDISNNKLVVLPNPLVEFTNLTTLNLSNNLLRCLPYRFGNLTKLRYLDITGNRLQDLPYSISFIRFASVRLDRLARASPSPSQMTYGPFGSLAIFSAREYLRSFGTTALTEENIPLHLLWLFRCYPLCKCFKPISPIANEVQHCRGKLNAEAIEVGKDTLQLSKSLINTFDFYYFKCSH